MSMVFPGETRLFYGLLFRTSKGVNVFQGVEGERVQFQGAEAAQVAPVSVDAAVVQDDPVRCEAPADQFEGVGGVAAYQPPVAKPLAVHEGVAAPEHGRGVQERVGQGKVQAGMDEHEVMEQQV